MTPEDPPRCRPLDVSDRSFSATELRGLSFIEECHVGADYWEDKTMKRYRAAGLVQLIDGRIVLTEAGRRLAAAAPKRS